MSKAEFSETLVARVLRALGMAGIIPPQVFGAAWYRLCRAHNKRRGWVK